MTNATIYIGDTVTLSVPLATSDGTAFTPGSDYNLIFTAKYNAADPDSDAVIQKLTGAGLTVTTSTAAVEIVPADTVNLSPGPLVCDIQAQHITSGAVLTVARVSLLLVRDITRETTTSITVYTTNPPSPLGGTGGDVAGDTHASASKATPVDTDELPLVDSASDPAFGLKKLTWGNLRAGITAAAFSDMSAGNYGNLLKTDGFGSIVINTVTGNTLLLKANGDFTAGFRTDTVDNPLSASRYYEAPNADGVIALTSSLTGIPDALHNGTLTGTTWTFGTGAAAAFLTAAGGGATGVSLFQAATVAAAREAIGEYSTLNTTTVTATTQNVWVDLSASLTLPAGTYRFDTIVKNSGVTTLSRLLFGGGESFLSTSDRIGNSIHNGSVLNISGNSSDHTATYGTTGGSASGSVIIGSGIVRITTQTTVKLQMTNTGASGTMTCYESHIKFSKLD